MGNIFDDVVNLESIFTNRNLVTPHYIPEKLPFREEQVNDIKNVLAGVLRLEKTDNLFIYGKTGTGKTSVTRHVMSQLLDYGKENDVSVKGIYVNCRNHGSKYRVFLKCCKELYPNKSFIGYSAGFVHEKIIEFFQSSKTATIVILDEIDQVKDLDDLVYALTRSNDEIKNGSLSIIGISNNLLFKEKLDARTKSSLCEKEMVFPPYNAEELFEILRQRSLEAFKEDSVTDSALRLASAIAAKESGDARRAVLLLLRAGELADKNKTYKVTESEVEEAKRLVEEEIIFNMVSTLPRQEQLVLYAISILTKNKKGIQKITGETDANLLLSGEVYEKYTRIAKENGENAVSARWYREYIAELEVYGLIITTQSGSGQRGQTRFIKLGFDAERMNAAIEKELI